MPCGARNSSNTNCPRLPATAIPFPPKFPAASGPATLAGRTKMWRKSIRVSIATGSSNCWRCSRRCRRTFIRIPRSRPASACAVKWRVASGPLDWAAGEALAFATLATEEARVRLSGQDSERGTFSHRHAVLHDVENWKRISGLSRISRRIRHRSRSTTARFPKRACLDLSTATASIRRTDWLPGRPSSAISGMLLRSIVDQFIAAAEDKWRRLSGITLLLPHGMEGQGPEHSSARLERFLELAADDNIQVVQPTTPAQLFHCLRRQVLRRWRKPLVRHDAKESSAESPGSIPVWTNLPRAALNAFLPDAAPANGAEITRILMCSGKVYFDLERERERLARKDVAILRLEQLLSRQR